MKKNKSYMIDLEFIKAFSKMSMTSICKKIGVNRSNLFNGKVSSYNMTLVRNYIVVEFDELVRKNMDDKYGKGNW